MKNRIHERAEMLLGPVACRNLGDMSVSTIHAFCARLLQDRFGYGNFEVLDENQEMAFLLQHGWDLGLHIAAAEKQLAYHKYCVAFKRAESVVNNERLGLATIRATPDAGTAEFAGRVEQYWGLLIDQRILTFDRLTSLAVEKLDAQPEAARWQHVIVDEYQDINRAQEALIRLLASRSATCLVVGDPRQCIYEWRGSDPDCFARFGQGDPVHAIPLLTNLRSGEKIIRAANTLAGHFADKALRDPMKATKERPGDGVVAYQGEADAQTEAASVVAQIECLVDTGAVGYSDIAILLRSINTSGDPFVRALEGKGIPYLVAGRMGLFRRNEAVAVAAVWLWLSGLDWTVDGVPYENEELLGLAADRWPGVFDGQAVGEFGERLFGGKYGNLTEAYYDLLARLGCQAWDPTDKSQAVRLCNLGRFSKLLVDFEASYRRQRGKLPSWDKLAKALGWYFLTYAQTNYAEQPADEFPVEGAVLLSTVHQAKGLEWPVVFVPALTDQRFPSRNAGKAQPWLLDRDLFNAERYEGGVEAERRLFYVAVTRARDVLVLSSPRAITTKSAARSRFLGECHAEHMPAADPARAAAAVTRRRAGDDEMLIKSVMEVLSYLRCPQEYRFRHVWGYEPELVRELGYGKSLHQVLRVLGERHRAGEDPAAILDDVLEREFYLPFVPPGGLRDIVRRLKPNLKSFLAARSDLLREAREMETRLEFLVGQRGAVVGRVDVIRGASDGLEVIDYKSGQEAAIGVEPEYQVRVYAAGLRDLGHAVIKASLVHVLDDGHPIVPVSIGDQDLEEARSRTREALRGIRGGDYPARPGAACERCEVRRLCRTRAASWEAVG